VGCVAHTEETGNTYKILFANPQGKNSFAGAMYK
jgi:hypothetical protein